MHKKVLDAYKKAGMELPLERAEDVNARIFYEKQKMSQKPINREIRLIVRIKEKDTEYFYYGQELTSEDSLGNEIHTYIQPVGKYEFPTFDYITDPTSKARIATGIRTYQTIHELKWPDQWTPELEKDVPDKVGLTVIAAGRHYGGYTWDDYKERTFQELVTFGRYGTFEPSPKIIQIEDQRRVEKDKEKRQRLK